MSQLKDFLALASFVAAFIVFMLFFLMLKNDQSAFWVLGLGGIFVLASVKLRRASQHLS